MDAERPAHLLLIHINPEFMKSPIPLLEILLTAAALALSQMIFMVAQRLALRSDRFQYVMLYARLLSGFMLGLVPLASLSFSLSHVTQFIHFTNALLTLQSALLFSVFAMFMTYRFAGRPENLRVYPQVRISHWTSGLLFCNSLSWMIYLAGYEFILRGFLFFPSMQSLPLAYAILLNLFLYSLAHLPKGRKETLGSIPFGLLLCILTAITGNIWDAFLIHAALAVSNDIFSIKANPRMHFV